MMHRRNLLRGAAGFTLALPFLPSLQSRRAAAQSTSGPLNFVAMGTPHGGLWGQNMYPADGTLNETEVYNHAIRRGALSVSGGALSPVLTGSDLSQGLANKMNVIRGLDVGFYLAHHSGGHLGNFAANVGDAPDQIAISDQPRATIDQLMAWSESFYPQGSPILERAMTVGGSGFSFFWSQPSVRTGEIQEISNTTSSRALFNRIFVPPEEETAQRPLIVDRVLEDYQRLRNSNRRLSSSDRQRLDDHMDRMHELERKLGVTLSCGDVVVPTRDSEDVREQNPNFTIDPSSQAEYWQLFNDVIVAAFICGSSRIATMHVHDVFSTFAGDWHQEIAHTAANPDGTTQQVLANAHQIFFQDVFLDLVRKLDAVDEGGGSTLLDRTYVQWTQESGAFTHSNISTPVVTAGSAGGAFQTGHYIDYRNLDLVAGSEYDDATEVNHAGLLYTQYLANVLSGMGIPDDEWQEAGGGYGVEFYTDYFGTRSHHESVSGDLSGALPFFRSV